MKTIESEIDKRVLAGPESCRLFHGRGRYFPGYEDLLIDWFKPVVLITLYSHSDSSWLDRLVALLVEKLAGIESIVLQQRYLKGSPSRILFGELEDEVYAVEDGLRYRLRLNSAQNIGFFPVMARGRRLVAQISPGKKILNLFAYSCSFSVTAVAAAAVQVVNLDMNRGALELGHLNHQINNLDLRKVSFLPLEVFRSFSRLRKLGPFDLIICDPPDRQGESFQPQRDWPKLVKKLPLLLNPGGEILFCLSSPHLVPQVVQQLVKQFYPNAQQLGIYYADDSFPEKNLEKGLNILHYRFA